MSDQHCRRCKKVSNKCVIFSCKTAASLNVHSAYSVVDIMDNLVVSFQMNNVIILGMVRAVKMNDGSCCVIGNVESSLRSEMNGH